MSLYQRYGWGVGLFPAGAVVLVSVGVAVAVSVAVAVAVSVGVVVGEVELVGVTDVDGVGVDVCAGCTNTVIRVLVGTAVPADGLWK